MDERPSFRRRSDLRRLVAALLIPWLLGGVAYLFPLFALVMFRSGLWADWMDPGVLVGFYSFGFLSLGASPILFLVGVWWLIRRPAYRRSWYGWVWLPLMYLNMWGVVTVIGH
jgi:hypothetical protein